MEEALTDHDRNLVNLLKHARSVNLKFNKNKLRLKLDQVTYVGQLFTSEGVHDNIKRKRQQTKAAYDKSARPLPELQIGEPVRLQPVNPKAPRDKGSCVAKVGPRSYLIETGNGNLYRCNRKFIHQDPGQGHQQPIITDSSSTKQSSPLPKPADVHPELTSKEERKEERKSQQPQTLVTRSGRVRVRPSRFADYV